jgi:hypothetical protein
MALYWDLTPILAALSGPNPKAPGFAGGYLPMEFRRAYAIEIRELPLEAPLLHSVMGWHRRFDDVPAHRWLRGTIVEATTTL